MPKDCLKTLEDWLDECEKLFTGIDLAKIVNMDETSIYLDFPGKYSYAKKGSRRVKATTTGNERNEQEFQPLLLLQVMVQNCRFSV